MHFNNTIQYSNISHKLLCYWFVSYSNAAIEILPGQEGAFTFFLALLKHMMQSLHPVFSTLHHFSLSQTLNDHSSVWAQWLTTAAAASLTLFDLVCDLLHMALALLLAPRQFGWQFVSCLSHAGFCVMSVFFILKDHLLYCKYELLKCLKSRVFSFNLLTFVV